MKYLYEQILSPQADAEQSTNHQFLQEVTGWITPVKSVREDKKSQEYFFARFSSACLLS